ncbi:Outer membrane protein assembly factor BamB, contains PQQ-like beta-propeller repeat [Haladaptatus litoreus]|uniref:Outer membrane protein assembly factor BamB, contains PQQ-like beta-propeller repeat n=1 Tax=Haladaptatus litoreus TaxID=553468 RepID=A0A1N6VZM9_9EURY|nr:PQQ-binding-like beta-propeller repeat protein [Haladaptatus litoreus]SIQ83331.1 Outer membrane protein assembly factor BamB, contains PQQ-like beta-propeller repeat [Haladaptatus litoreus]
MSRMTRRRALLTAGTAGFTTFAGYRFLSDDGCPTLDESLWTIDGRYWSPPVKHGGKILASEHYTGMGDRILSRIICADSYDGQEQWVYTVKGSGAGIPLVHDDTVYVGTGTDHVYALDFETGHRKWDYDAGGLEEFGGGAWGQPAVIDDSVFVGISHSELSTPDVTDSSTYTHRVVALDTSDGTERWANRVSGTSFAGPARFGTSVVAGTESGHVYRFDAVTGESLWSTSIPGEVRSTPIVGNGVVYVTTLEGAIVSLDAESAQKEWQVDASGAIVDVVDTGDSLLVGDRTGAVTAVAKSDGTEQWQYTAEEAVAAIDVSTDVWILDQRGTVHRLDTATGETTHRYYVAESNVENQCGWSPRSDVGSGIIADEYNIYVTGPWVGRVSARIE